IAVITTGPSSGHNAMGKRRIVPTTSVGCLSGLITKGDPEAETKFARAIDAGTDGNGNEQGIRQSLEGLTCTVEEESWLRANSTVAVLIISDEDNCSTGSCSGRDWASADATAWPGAEKGDGSSLVNYLHSIRPPEKSAVYGIYWDPAVEKAQCTSGYYKGSTYKSVIAATGGTGNLICAPAGQQPDFAAVLKKISSDVQLIIQNDFLLSQTPV